MKASKDMDKLGIEILSCNIQNVTDENGLIKDLGADNTSLIKKNAAIAKAQADRDIAIAQAEADKAARGREFFQIRRLHRKTMSWRFAGQNSRSYPIIKRLRQMLLTRFRHSHSKRVLRQRL